MHSRRMPETITALPVGDAHVVVWRDEQRPVSFYTVAVIAVIAKIEQLAGLEANDSRRVLH